MRLIVAAAALSACGLTARGAQDAPPDSVIPDASSSGDASISDAGLADASDASAAKQCVTFANTIAPFVYEGDDGGYTLAPGKVALSLASGKSARLYHVFTAPKVYARTLVDVHVGASVDSGSWGGTGADYMNLLQHFNGATRDMASSSRLDIAMRQTVLELNVWAPIQTNHALGGMSIPGADAHFTIDTKWASGENGAVVVAMNPTTGGVPSWPVGKLATSVTGPTDKLTVVLGGSGVNVVPNIRLSFFDICVTFDP